MRLDKLLSNLGAASRSGCREMLRKGRVTVNGVIARDGAVSVPEGAIVALDEQPLDTRLARHLMLHKPAGVLTAREDGRQETVMDLLPPVYAALGCMPVGRLDKDTTGLLLLTTDGELGHRLIAPNRHGLPGFGSEWCEEISGDWTGQCMDDYLTAIDDAAENLPFVDKDRLGAVGASFGGFSVYYLAGHHDKRFKCFIAHDGAFNLESMYTDTEEVWFSNWEYEDAYWNKDLSDNAKKTYDNSPHKFVDKWDTPILCIHGEMDYRINANQGMGAFNAAQLRGIPSELLIFPDENHWVLKPQNGILWQRTYFDWLAKWLKQD